MKLSDYLLLLVGGVAILLNTLMVTYSIYWGLTSGESTTSYWITIVFCTMQAVLVIGAYILNIITFASLNRINKKIRGKYSYY
ncbi:hypothetical protein GMNKNHGO_00091 [Enterococcus phage vB_Efa29212_3e]|uniref:Uncharacterized protein n=1 Tax=Enterococcus phage vB_Efa29212_3e TaxID=2982224 RepID=A0A978AAN0_9CAUD|nr:hypothetical protein GMNKNHGO_00091 [Enterococcus phage vB_Efa29212_3e]